MDRKQQELEHVRGRNLTATIDEQTLLLLPKVFKTGSLGWHGQGKVTIDDTRCQLSVVVTVIGSKPASADGTGPYSDPLLNKLAASVQKDNGPPSPLEAPPATSPLFGDVKPPKRGRKRS